MRSDVCFPALTCSLLEQMTCTIVLSWTPVMGIHPCWHLSQPQSPWPCCGSHLHPFITAIRETPSGRQHLPSANFHTMDGQTGYHSLWSLDPVRSHPVPFYPYFSLSWDCCKVADSQSAIWEASHKSSFCSELKQKGISTVSHPSLFSLDVPCGSKSAEPSH